MTNCKFQAGAIFTSQVMDFQVHAIGKAIRLLFTDLLTIVVLGCIPIEQSHQ